MIYGPLLPYIIGDMAKPKSAADLLEAHIKLNKQADDALNFYLPENPAIERKTALLIGRSAAFFSGARPRDGAGRWVISLSRKLLLLREFELNTDEILKMRAGVKC